MEDNNIENIDTNNQIEKQSDKYPYAEKVLEEIKDQYNVENDRENKINTKASAFITVIVAIITIYIPLVPFERLKSFLMESLLEVTYVEKCLAIVFLVVLVVGISFLIIAFIYMVRAYTVKGYNQVNIDNLLSYSRNEKNIKDESEFAYDLVEHYYKILIGTNGEEGNMSINTKSADVVASGIIWTVVGFVITSLSTIALRIIVT